LILLYQLLVAEMYLRPTLINPMETTQMTNRLYKVIISCLLLTLLSACGGQSQPTPSGTPIGEITNPLIILPGLAASSLVNNDGTSNQFNEVWPNLFDLAISPSDTHLDVLGLASNGVDPLKDTPSYTTIRANDVIRQASLLNLKKDVYQITINHFLQNGYVEGKSLFICPYDWRKSVVALEKTVDDCITQALKANPEATQVDVFAHSMGGTMMRHYLTDAERAKRVSQLITAGTPYLGAPRMGVYLLDNLCFLEIYVCIVDPNILKRQAVNYPIIYELLPSTDYFQLYDGYMRRNYDANQDGTVDGLLTAAESATVFSQFNPDLYHQAETLHRNTGGWANGGTNGVEVVAIAGYGHATMHVIIEEDATPTLTMEHTNGDGSIPLYSGAMQNLETGVDLSGGVPVFYVEESHQSLAYNQAVLQFAVMAFNGVDYETARAKAGLDATPKTLTGQVIAVKGNVRPEVFDHEGNLMGRLHDSHTATSLIPNATHDEVSGTTYMFLHNTRTYTINLHGHTDNETVDMRLHRFQDDQPLEPIVYQDVPVQNGSKHTLSYDPTQIHQPEPVVPPLQLDHDGDGTHDDEHLPE